MSEPSFQLAADTLRDLNLRIMQTCEPAASEFAYQTWTVLVAGAATAVRL